MAFVYCSLCIETELDLTYVSCHKCFTDYDLYMRCSSCNEARVVLCECDKQFGLDEMMDLSLPASGQVRSGHSHSLAAVGAL